MTTFKKKVLQTIRQKKLLTGNETVLVALSGGADSVSLLHVMLELSHQLNIKINAAHFNHLQRGEESERDEAFVRRLCQSLSVPLFCGELRDLADDSESNLENKLRIQRYNFLADCALKQGAVIATGHNLNDQAETFLLKLFRGAGVTGLSGIRISRTHSIRDSRIRVVRPLLRTQRSEILSYLEERGLNYREDATNASTEFDRNWIRHELIPEIENRVNPQLNRVLHRTADLFEDIQKFLDQEAGNWIETNAKTDNCDEILEISRLFEIDLVIRREVFRTMIQRLIGNTVDITRRHVDSILELSTGSSGKQLCLPCGIRVLKEFDSLRFTFEIRRIPDFEYSVTIPGKIAIREVGKLVSIRKSGNKTPFSTFLTDKDSVVVRNRRPGDNYRINDKSKLRSLKKILVEQKVPLSHRSQLLIFELIHEVVWVEGFPTRSVGDGSGGDRYEIVIEEMESGNQE